MKNNVLQLTKEYPQSISKVIAIGELSKNPYIFNELLADIYIVPCVPDVLDSDKLKEKQSYDFSRLQKIQIGAGQLVGLCVGSFLKDKTRILAVPEYTQEKFKITASDYTQIQAGDSYFIGKNKFRYIPKSHYYLPNELDKMPCKVFQGKTDDGLVSKVIIPDWTLFQYYYANSSRLTNAIINGDLERNNKVFHPDLTYFDENDFQKLHLHLGREMFIKDRWTIARFVSHPELLNRAININRSLIKNHNEERGAFPEVSVPFFGDSKIKVSGKWIRDIIRDNESGRYIKGEWVFFVEYIQSCSGGYLLDEMSLSRQGDKLISSDNSLVIIDEEEDEQFFHVPKPGDDAIIRSDEQPRQTKGHTETKMPPRNNKNQPTKVERVFEETAIKQKPKKTTHIPISGGDLSTATGCGGNGTTTTLLITTEDGKGEEKLPKPSFNIESVMNVLDSLVNDYPEDIRYYLRPVIPLSIAITESDDYTKRLSAFPASKSEKRNPWAFIPSEGHRPRRVLIAEIIFEGRVFYLFETEKRPENYEKFCTFVVDKNFTELSNEEITKLILNRAAEKNGVWLLEKECPELIRRKFRHIWTIEDFAETLRNYFNERIESTIKRTHDVTDESSSKSENLKSDEYTTKDFPMAAIRKAA